MVLMKVLALKKSSLTACPNMIFILLLVIPLASAKVYPRTGVDGTSNIHDEVEGVLYEIPEYEDPDLTLYKLAQRGAFPVITVMEVAKEPKDLIKDEGAKHHYQINGVRTEVNDAMAQLYFAKTKLEKGDDQISMDIDKTIYFLMNLKHRLHQETGLMTSPAKTSSSSSSSNSFPKHSLISDVLAEQHLPFVASNGQPLPPYTSKKQLSLSNTYDKQFSPSKTSFESSTSDISPTINYSSSVPSETTAESVSSVDSFFAIDSLSKKYAASKLSMTKYLASHNAEQRFPSFAAATEQSDASESSDEQNLTTTTPAKKYSAVDASDYRYPDFDTLIQTPNRHDIPTQQSDFDTLIQKPKKHDIPTQQSDFDTLIQKPNKHDIPTQQSLSFVNPKMQYVVSYTSVEPVLTDFVSSEKRSFASESSQTDPSFSTENPDTDGAVQEKIPEGLHEDSVYIAGTNKHEINDKTAIRKKWSWIPPEIE